MAGYSAELLTDESGPYDVRIIRDGKTQHMWGKFGRRKETELAETVAEDEVPLLAGSGIGIAAELLAARRDRPLLILETEKEILEATGLRGRLPDSPNVVWITDSSPVDAARQIKKFSTSVDRGVRFLKIPFYLRLSPFYLQVEKLLQDNGNEESAPLPRPKFQGSAPRILLLTSQYFLMGEIVAACQRRDIPHMLINMDAKEMDLDHFVERISTALSSFRPDFVLTVNHLGVDQEGVLNSLLHKFKIPLASWFVDNPMLILPLYKAQADTSTTIFTWDADRMDALREMGFNNIFHLPLGTDQTRFLPSKVCSESKWARDISFVGNSMVHKTARRLEAARLNGPLLEKWKDIAGAFGEKSEPSVQNFLRTDFPHLLTHYENLVSPYRKLAFETLVIWQATLEYRLSCVKKTLPYNPLIVGDDGWKLLLAGSDSWEYHSELSYYEDLPRFYPCSKINFNCTSQQMKGAVNQRVFDVPACNGFLLTDHRYQVENLFEPGREIAIYSTRDEIPELIERYLGDREARERIIKAARKRILAEHTYDCRITKLVECMRQVYA
ncbi:glycosyltransferase [Maridesulfovibrio sp.]|uniref:CgeB family protein n=1 Tax=Maridesulfovibrio sp. TaxID=2795000 RepID=UPI002A186C03|nr:glycosyltransferase [Maridesulfovibrio sp.]